MADKNDAAVARRPGASWGRLLRDTQGVVALEFAFIATPLVLLLFCASVSGINLMALGLLNAATKEAGRQIQIGAIRDASDSAARTLICGYLTNLVPTCSSTLVLYAASGPTFSVVQAATVTGTTLSRTTFTPGGRGSSVVLQAAVKSPFGLTLANVQSSMLMSTATFMNEP